MGVAVTSHRCGVLAVAVVQAVVQLGCGHSAPASRSRPDLSPSASAALGPEDILEVRVLGEQEFSGLYQVGADGTFDFPLIGSVRAAGGTTRNVAREVTERLRDGEILRNPQVTVFLKEQRSRKVTVLGAVQKPGTFAYVDRLSILEAISLAGGFTPMAAKNDTLVTRRAERHRVMVEDIAEGRLANFYLQPGDSVLVPERVF